MAKKKVQAWASTAGRREWRDALRLELSRADGPTGKALERIARLVVHNALNGDLDCIQEIAVRLDGKPSTAVDPVTEQALEKLIVQWGGTSAPALSPGGFPMKAIEGALEKAKN